MSGSCPHSVLFCLIVISLPHLFSLFCLYLTPEDAIPPTRSHRCSANRLRGSSGLPHAHEQGDNCFRFCSAIGIGAREGHHMTNTAQIMIIVDVNLWNAAWNVESNLEGSSRKAKVGRKRGEFANITLKVRHNWSGIDCSVSRLAIFWNLERWLVMNQSSAYATGIKKG